MSSVILCREKPISDRGCREGLRLQKKLSLRKKRVRNQNFAMFLLLDSKIGDQETNEWLTALIDDYISNLKKKMEDYFPISEPSSA